MKKEMKKLNNEITMLNDIVNEFKAWRVQEERLRLEYESKPRKAEPANEDGNDAAFYGV